jgi:argininosuccinate lyase
MKGLPLTYGKDMQEDKEPTFEATDSLALCVAAMTGMVRDMTPDEAAMARATRNGHLTATDLADGLVRLLGIPFREAHEITGRIVRLADGKGAALWDLALTDLQSIEPRITADLQKVLSVENSVASRQSFGGTAPDRVRQAIARAREQYR